MIPLFNSHIPNSAIEAFVSHYDNKVDINYKKEKFSEHFGWWTEAKHIIPFKNYETPLEILLKKFVKGKDVLLSPLSNYKNLRVIKKLGLNPIFIDVDSRYGNINIENISKKITDESSVIIISCMGGILPNIQEIKDNIPSNISLIIDGNHTFGTKMNDKYISNYDIPTIFNFDNTNIININNISLLASNIDLHINDNNIKYNYSYNYNEYDVGISELEIILGLEQLNHVFATQLVNQSIYNTYKSEIKRKFRIFDIDESIKYNYNTFHIYIHNKNEFNKYMIDQKIETGDLFNRLDILNNNKEHLPGVEKYLNHSTFLPIGWWIKGKKQEHIIYSINRFS